MQQIIQKIHEEKSAWKNSKEESSPEIAPEDVTTRLFLSHKRTTGQKIVGRLYEELKGDYKIFLDSETKFKIHNLKEIVKNTDVFIFVLSQGVLQSFWCLQELISALENKKRVIIVRDLAFNLPESVPEEWKPVEHIILDPNQLIWIAEYNTACIQALKKRIGSPDDCIAEAKKAMEAHPEIVTQMKEGKLEPSFLVTDKGLMGLLDFCTTPLKSIDFTQAVVNDETFKYFVFSGKGKEIETINLKGCNNIRDEGLKYIAEACPNLRSLNVNTLLNITDVGLQYLAEGCPLLQHIELTPFTGWGQRTKTTAEGLKHLVKGCQKLQNLNLSSYSVNDDALKNLADNCPELKEINLSYTSVTDEGVNYLTAKHPNAKITK